ncbi:hypothetical protein VP01_11161g1, partial [Puccinia sorghi]
MGTSRNGSAIGMLARFFRISEGTVILHCSCLVQATMAHESIAETTGFKKCKPSIDSQDYYSRKGYYGIATLIVCDTDKRILYYLTGWPG